MSKRKADTAPAPEAGDPQSGKPASGTIYFFPNLDPEQPALSIEADSREQAEERYHQHLKEAHG